MNYQLALELKNAGFPQRFVGGDHHLSGWWIDEDNKPYGHENGNETECYVPTLSELIEAIQVPFSLHKQADGRFNAEYEAEPLEPEWFEGFTPLEAVAKLYIVLHKK